jgi:hypothetical protein
MKEQRTMHRRKLLAAVAGWLSVPALAIAQVEAPPIPDLPVPLHIGASESKDLPAAGPNVQFVSQDKSPSPGSATADVIPPKKLDANPMVSIEQAPLDGRWLRRRNSTPLADPAAPPLPTEPAIITPATGPFEPNARAWIVPEYILWRTTGMHVPALVTSSPFGTASSSAGVLGNSSTSVLFGNDKDLGDFRSGIRVRGGFWIENTQTLGLDAGFFYLGQKRHEATFVGQGFPAIARPFVDASTGAASAEPVIFAAQNADGSATTALAGRMVASTTTDLWGADFNFRRYLFDTDSFRLDGLIGYRYQRLRDTIETASNSTVESAAVFGGLSTGSVIEIRDLFHTTNNFNGGQLGLTGEWRGGRWTIGMTGKIALGVTEQEVRINGLTSIAASATAPPQVFSGGLLAQPTNISRFRADQFSVIPEVGLNIGFQLSSNIRIFGGYSFMYWSDVVRAGDQIDLTVNTTQLTRSTTAGTLSGVARPTFIMNDTSLWAHGANIGVEIRW